jgi:hypothetical protein
MEGVIGIRGCVGWICLWLPSTCRIFLPLSRPRSVLASLLPTQEIGSAMFRYLSKWERVAQRRIKYNPDLSRGHAAPYARSEEILTSIEQLCHVTITIPQFSPSSNHSQPYTAQSLSSPTGTRPFDSYAPSPSPPSPSSTAAARS